MKAPERPNREEPLSRVLSEWAVNSQLPPGFQAAVFHRIHESQRQSPRTFWLSVEYWIATAFARPAVVTLLFASFISLGLATGWKTGQRETAHTKAELSQRYLQLLAPQSSTHAEMK